MTVALSPHGNEALQTVKNTRDAGRRSPLMINLMSNTTSYPQRSGRRSRVTGTLRGCLLVLVGAVLVLLSGLPAASQAATAVSSYAVGSQFGQDPPRGTGDAASTGVAVGQSTGNIFIAETNQNTVGIFAPDAGSGGTFLTIADFNPAGQSALNLAVDPANEALYAATTVYGNGIAKEISDGAPTPAYSIDSGFAVPPGAIVAPGGMAVDPTTHDLLVVDNGANRVFRLSSSTGAVISSFDGSDTSAGAFQAPGSIAVGPTGTIYVVDTAGARVEQFTAAGTSTGALSLPAGALPASVTVNPQNGDIAVLLGLGSQTYLQGFTAGGTRTFTARVTAGVTVPAFGIVWDGTTNRIYAGLGNGFARALLPATQPGVDPPVATPGRNTVHLTTDVDPGGEDTTARFEYCPATAACDNYLLSNPNDPANPWQRGPDHTGLTTAGPITDDLPLGSNASWRVRVYATNTATGTDTTSPIVDFDSPLLTPGVTTGNAGSITESQAELTGSIDTLGDQTTYHFEYGLTTNYGSRVPAGSESPAGNNRTSRTVVKGIAGLQSGTTYHYRLVAQNTVGGAGGVDRTFTTAGPDDVAPHRAYEQVTPVDKQGATVNSVFHVQAATDGSAIAVATSSASTDAAGSRILQNYLSRRGPSDWLDWQKVEAPQNAARGIFEASTAAVSSDFDHALVVSNRALASGGIEGGGNIYIRDLRTGDYTFVAGAPGGDAYASLAGLQANEQIYMAGAPDFSWILFWGHAPFLPGTPVGDAIYRWSRTGGLKIESRWPDDSVVGVQFPGASRKTGTAASASGDVVAFSAGGVYRRANGQTTAISVSRVAGDSPDPQGGTLEWVTPDGRYIVFESPARLTDAAVSDAGGDALYRYDANAVTNQRLQFIGNVTPFDTWDVYGVSDDGRTIYFDAFGGEGTKVWRDGQVRLITAAEPKRGDGGAQTFVTANGRYFAWVESSFQDGSIVPDRQAYRYDAEADQSVCVSCLADGSPGKPARLMSGGRGIGNRPTRVMTESGVVFFETASRLVTADHNGTTDVYSYGARPTLISPGDGAFNARFVDASDDGSNVFFQTDEGLVSQDTDGNVDVYDARVGGGFPAQSPLPPPAPCVRAECGELGTGPVISPSAASSTTAGSSGLQRTNQGKVVLSLSKVSFGAKSVRVTFKASQRGRVRVTGSRVATTVRNVAKAGSYSVIVPLSKKARALLRVQKKLKVSLKVSLSGGWGSASAKYSRTLGN
jgi:DNA-binding beta-propeller fold protein YncE